MPQYRVGLKITKTELIDLMADNESEARYGATVVYGDKDGAAVEVMSVTLISGQPVEEYQPVNEPMVQGEEDGA